MKNSKLNQVLKLLTLEEWKQLGRWLHSPWCNSHRKLKEFYNIYDRYKSKLDRLDKEKCYRKMYPGKKYDPKGMNNLMRDMLRQVEQFLIHTDLAKDGDRQQRLLQQSYFDRQAYRRANGVAQERQKKLQQKKVREWEDYLELAILYDQQYFHPEPSIRYQLGNVELLEGERSLDHFYAMGKFRLLHERFSRKALLQTVWKEDPEYQHLAHLKEQLQHPVIELYYLRLSRSEDWDETQYAKFKTYYLKHFEDLPRKEQKIFLMYAINDAIVLNSKGNQAILNTAFSLYQKGLKEGLLLHNGQLSTYTFSNVIGIGCVLGEHDKIRHFIKDYLPLLSETSRAEAHLWAKAQLACSEEDLEVCTKLIGTENFEDRVYNILAKVTLLKAYYKLSLIDIRQEQLFLYHCDNFEKYMRRNKLLSLQRIEGYLRLIQYCRRLHRIASMAGDKRVTHKQRLWAYIEKEENFVGKNWLYQQIERL